MGIHKFITFLYIQIPTSTTYIVTTYLDVRINYDRYKKARNVLQALEGLVLHQRLCSAHPILSDPGHLALKTLVRPHQRPRHARRPLTRFLRAGRSLVFSTRVVVHTRGCLLVVIAGDCLCRLIHDARPPAESSIHRMADFEAIACSWFSYVHGVCMFMVAWSALTC